MGVETLFLESARPVERPEPARSNLAALDLVTVRDRVPESYPDDRAAMVRAISADLRTVAVDMVRRAIGPNLGAADLLRAVRVTARMVLLDQDPRDVAARRKAIAVQAVRWADLALSDIAESVPVDPIGRAIVKPARTRSGRATVKVIRHGDAPVIGSFDRDITGARLLAARGPSEHEIAPATAMAYVLHRRAASGELARHLHGWSGIGVARCTVGLGDQLDRLIGADTIAWQQMLPGDRSSVCPAAHRVGSWGDEANDTIAALMDANAAQAHQMTRRPPRLVLKRGKARQGEPTPIISALSTLKCHAWRGSMGARGPQPRGPQPWHLVALVAPAADLEHRYVGHNLVARPATDTIKRSTRKASRTIAPTDERGPIVEPDTEQGWQAIADRLNRGERVVIGRVTITRATSGKLNATDRRHDDGPLYWQGLRTTTGLARKLALAAPI